MATTDTPKARPPVRTFAYSTTALVMCPDYVRAVDHERAPDTVDLHLGGGVITTASLDELREFVAAQSAQLDAVEFARGLAVECAEVSR